MSRNPRRLMGMEPRQHQHQQRPALSPWEGGFAPGSSGSGGGGLLPTPPVPSLLSQFSSPEAQLAVASNLLTSLLRPVQNNQSLMQSSNNQVPSLMSLGTSGGSLGSYGGLQQQSSYRDRDNYARGQYNEYSDSPPSQMQRRSFDSYRNRSPVRNAPKRIQQSGRARQGRAASPPAKPRPASSSDQQRDFKREQPNKKEAVAKDLGAKKGAVFEGLPKSAFHCPICKKNMWDALSFDNHVRGMAHQRMLAEREKSYQVKADLLRHDAKLDEQQNQIEMERLVRMGKKILPGRREYCKMCDFTFFGDLGAHRKSKIHQNLKNFLHPKCNNCQKEFALRIELDKHLLTADHLKKVFKDKMKKPEGSAAKMEVDDENSKKESQDKKTDAKEEEGEDAVTNEEKDVEMAETEESEEPSKETDDSATKESTDTKATVVEDVPKETVKINVYDPDIAVGKEFLMPVTGMFCKACRRFFLHEDQALQSHCRTLGHFNNCLALSNQKVKLNSTAEKPNDAIAAPTTGKRVKVEDAVENQDAKRPKTEELYDPMGESPPTPELAKFEEKTPEASTEKIKEEDASLPADLDDVDKNLNDLINEFDGENSSPTAKNVEKDESSPTGSSSSSNAGRARRGRSFRGRGKV